MNGEKCEATSDANKTLVRSRALQKAAQDEIITLELLLPAEFSSEAEAAVERKNKDDN